ncbi:hypothetical protein [Cryptosporangium minutisporangium]|uniref:hypothetical protein n=1 Tax=Cryptosporangium minutisporangium TaxID=113569 RepID=UPI0031E4F01E
MVTEAHMQALFGYGMHPDADRIIATYQESHARAGMTEAQIQRLVEDARRAAALGRSWFFRRLYAAGKYAR